MSQLFSPFRIDSLELKNRIVIAPMCQYSAVDGQATDWHVMHLGQMAASGAGLLIIEATGVTPDGRISPYDLGLWSDETEAALQRTLTAVREYSSIRIGIQLAHAGRKASSQAPWEGGALLSPENGGWQTVAPSPIPHGAGEAPPAELDAAGMARIREGFVAAARRAVNLGIDLIELHSAHGYLLHQFLSPLSNQRTDAYGGSLENRMRFPLEVFAAVRAVVPDHIPVGVRLSGTDWVEGGWDIEQSIPYCQALQGLGCSYLHVSSGGVSTAQKIPLGPGYQVPLAEAIRATVDLPVMTVGLITEPEQAEQIVASCQADLVALARGMLYNPRWPWHAAAKLGAQVEVPKQYWRCQPSGLKALFAEAKIGQR